MSLARSRSSAADDEDLKARIAELTARLEEAEDTLCAIRDGDVDAIAVGSDVHTLGSAGAASNRFRGDMLAQVSDAVIATDLKERVTFLNAAAERRYGVSAAEVLGCRLANFMNTAGSGPATKPRRGPLCAIAKSGMVKISTSRAKAVSCTSSRASPFCAAPTA